MSIAMTIHKKVDINATQRVEKVGTLMVQGDANAHVFELELYEEKQPKQLGREYSVVGVFVRKDGIGVPLGGTITGNLVSVQLDDNCYLVPGIFRFSIKIVWNGETRTVFKCTGSIDQEDVSEFVDDEAHTSFDDLVEKIVADYLEQNPPSGGGIEGDYVRSVNGQTGDVTLSIPTQTSELTNNSGFITNAVSDLTNYYLKSETYTREEINQRISQIPKFTISVVSALPTSGDATTIYLVGGGVSGDLYTEYIWANGAWEILGSQRVDLTGYATETWVNGQLGSYLKASELETAINTVLAQAAASGQFDGADGVGIAGVSVTRSPDENGYLYIIIELTDGQTQHIPYRNGVDGQDGEDGASVTVTNVSESTADGGSNVVTFSDGKTLTVMNGSKGSKGAKGEAGKTPVKGTDYWTAGDKAEIIEQVIAALGGTPFFGVVDENNVITLTGYLEEGTYTLKYEDSDGNVTEIGTLEYSNEPEVTYTNLFDPATAILNQRMSGGSKAPKTENGYVMTAATVLPTNVNTSASYDDSTPYLAVPAAMWTGSANLFGINLSGEYGAYVDAGTTPGTTVGAWKKVPIYNQWGGGNVTIKDVVLSLKVGSSSITAADIQDIGIYFNELPE